MAKRFYNTQRIEEDWYINLSCKHRELLRYCESKCDGAGIFSWNSKIATTYIGEKITDADLSEIPVTKLPNGKYFLNGFCYFQNGKLSAKSPAHNSIFKSLADNEVSESVLFCRVVDTLHSRDKEEEIEIEEEKEEEGKEERQKAFAEKVKLFGGGYDSEMLKAFFNYWTESNEGGKKMRFEMEKVFDIGKRLVTWHNNNKKFNNGNKVRKGQPDTDEAMAWANSVLSGQVNK